VNESGLQTNEDLLRAYWEVYQSMAYVYGKVISDMTLDEFVVWLDQQVKIQAVIGGLHGK